MFVFQQTKEKEQQEEQIKVKITAYEGKKAIPISFDIPSKIDENDKLVPNVNKEDVNKIGQAGFGVHQAFNAAISGKKLPLEDQYLLKKACQEALSSNALVSKEKFGQSNVKINPTVKEITITKTPTKGYDVIIDYTQGETTGKVILTSLHITNP